MASNFGLYLDDYWRVPAAMDSSWKTVWGAVAAFFQQAGQGRPLHDSLIFFLSRLGSQAAGLAGIHWIGFLLCALNAWLFYILARRASSRSDFAFLGAAAFCLSPVYTTWGWITFSAGVQPAVTFLLLALLAYLTGKRALSYLAILASLLTYETLFLPFLSAPLLKESDRWPTARELLRHLAVCLALLGGVFLMRIRMGDPRVLTDPLDLARTSVEHTLLGPLAALGTFAYRPLLTLQQIDWALFLLLLAGFVVLTAALWHFAGRTRETADSPKTLSAAFKPFTKLGAAGGAMLVLAYPLTLIGPVLVVNGPHTRIHTAAAVGSSILFACVATPLLRLAAVHGLRKLALAGLCGFLALLLGFGWVVQRDYAASWRHQRSFWTDVARLCPDLEDGTLILVDSRGLPEPRQMVANGWHLPLILEQIYSFPPEWEKLPKVYRLQPDWENAATATLPYFTPDEKSVPWAEESERRRLVEWPEIIFLTNRNGSLTRPAGVSINGQEIAAKPAPTDSSQEFNRGRMFDLLIPNPPDGRP